MTDAEILAFRTELLADPRTRHTDMPYACLRALRPARGRRQTEARESARRLVEAGHHAWRTWGAS